MNEFKTYHPIVNFIYFIFVIGFSCFLMHPVCLCISWVGGFVCSVMCKGRTAIRRNLLYMLLAVSLTALINSAFNHQGGTVISYLPDGNPLTLESILYGIGAAVMIVSVICHFSCYNEVMTSDKFIYLFGRIIPALSMIISMTLRFVPRFIAQVRVVADAQRCVGQDVSRGSVIKRAKYGLNILSVMTTWSLENSVETADSMKSRGYGLPGRSTFSIYKFDKRDAKALACILILGVYTFVGSLTGGMYFRYFPSIQAGNVSAFSISVFVAYFLLCMCPIIIEIREVVRWKASESRI